MPPAEPLPFALDPLATRPRVEPGEAAAVALAQWGIKATATPLPGERDRNFLLEDGQGARFVLKISSRAEDRSRVDMQLRMARHARARDPGLNLSESVPAGGQHLVACPFRGGEHLVRLLPFVRGRPLSAFRRRPPVLLESVGRLLGRLQRALAGFDHPGLNHQELPWDPAHAVAVMEAAVEVLPEGEAGELYRRVGDSIRSRMPRLFELPDTALHNDANDDNVLLLEAEPESASPDDLALLDFGDALRAPAIIEAATAAVYVAAAAVEPLRAAATVLAGFARERPVDEEEADAFRTAVALRALVSAGVAALRRKHVPGADREAYLMTSEAGIWRFLAALDSEAPELTRGRFRMAAGHAPRHNLETRHAAIRQAAANAIPPISLDGRVRILDLSPVSPKVDPACVTHSIEKVVAAATQDGGAAVGRYLEPRCAEATSGPRFRPPGVEPATRQLDAEVFRAAGTSVRAPLDARVAWASGSNGGDEESGASVGLRHRWNGESFWTVYRHLDATCLSSLRPGDELSRGAVFGRLMAFTTPERPARLSFQVTTDDFGGSPPRRSTGRDAPVLAALSPDPTGFLGLDDDAAAATVKDLGADETDRLLKLRKRHISGALSLSYESPIQVVRGRGARLYDQEGRDFLDMVNNVCHVGHAHPRVVEAIRAQAQLLNTNTRYLYRNLTDYAGRLAATLPAPLEVVFLTNSGSEANDLALRIARTHLGRRETLVFDGGYHGNLTSLIEVSPYKLDGKGGRPGPAWLHRLPMPDGFRGRFRDSGPDFAAALTTDAATRVGELGPATLISEAILSCGGQIVPPPGYVRALYQAVRNAGGLIVADEVQTGFGRVGPDFWAFLDVQRGKPAVWPDIVTLGKPAGNGHPLGAVVTTRELAASFDNGMEYFNTFGGNPVSCAAGLAVLDVIREERLAEHAGAVGDTLLKGLKHLQNRYPILGQVRGRGLFLGFELVRDPGTREPAAAEATRLVNRLRDFRVLNSTDGPDANVIKLKPPLAFSPADAAHYLEVLEYVLEEQF